MEQVLAGPAWMHESAKFVLLQILTILKILNISTIFDFCSIFARITPVN